MQDTTVNQDIPSSHATEPRPPVPGHTLFSRTVWLIIILALLSGVILLFTDTNLIGLAHAPISAAPLLLIGVAYLGFQVLLRPRPLDLLKALIVSTAFILWGVDQLLAAGWFATTLGDIVITLYVIDLGWIMLDRLRNS